MLKHSGQTPSPSTLFQIGSITKTFTSLLLAIFVERRLIQLDDPLQKYVPKGIKVPSYNDRQILLADLATHTSGLPRNAPMRSRQHELGLDDMYELLNRAKLTSQPGLRMEYSNWGYALLAEALVRASKAEDYQGLLEREVLAKLGMSETTLRPSAEANTKVAQGYAKDGYPAAWNLQNWPAFNGAGALYSSLGDMLKYLAFNLSLMQTSLNSILSVVHQPRVRALTPGRNVGLAWQIRDYPKLNLTIIEHNGATLGFQSYIGFIRGQPTGVVVLANCLATEAQQIGRAVLTLRLGNHRSSTASP